MADSTRGKLGIVVGGGPAPGINGVISSVTIEAINQGLEVVGIRDGFKHLVNGDIAQVRPLTIPDVAPLYQRGGVMLGTSRTNPAKDPDAHGERARGAEPARHQVPGHHRRRRHRVQRQPGLRQRGRHDPRRPRAQDDRQRPAAAAGHPDVRLRDRPALRRAARPQPARGRQDHHALVPHRQHGPGGRAPRARASARRRPPRSPSSPRSSRAAT